MRKFSIMILVLLLFVGLATPVCAELLGYRVVDQAGLVNVRELLNLSNELDALRGKHGVDVVVVTAETLEGKSPRDYADDFYDSSSYCADGILLLVSMEDRDWWISTSGYGITAFTDAGIEYMADQIVPALSEGAYAKAFKIYADQCDEFLAQAKTGDPYDYHNLPQEPFKLVKNLIISLVIGFVLALIVTGIMKANLKTVRAQQGAGNYVKPGSLNVTHRQDLFLYRHVHRTPKPKDNGGSGTHRSSSGSSHGGGGGKF